MSVQLVRIKPRYPLLKTLGVSVQHFPHYVNRKLVVQQVDVALISFIVRGRGWHYIGRERFEESGASMAVTHFGQKHGIVTDAEGMEVINVYLDPSHHVLPALPPPLQGVLPLLVPLHPRFVNSLNRIVRIQLDDAETSARHLLTMEREANERKVGWEESIQLHWRLFLMLCCRQVLATGFVAPTRNNPDMERVRVHLDTHYADQHTLASLSHFAQLTPTSLCRAFKAYTGKPVFSYLLDRRIQAAMLQLRSGDGKVVAIAMENGFTDLSFFHRKFRAIAGMTPNQYRQKFMK